MHKLADEAPSDIKDDWDTLVEGVDKIVAAIKKAGLDDADMATLQSGQIPDGVDMAALQSLMAEIQSLDTEDFAEGRATTSTSTPRTSAGSTYRRERRLSAPRG